ncbi:SMC family ATPase [Actinomycetes bacterium KLBMP 9759]
MRPVLLEMAGFAAFREPTTVDFVGAEYFALVGPTGAGKSTVIDAMTFALYGSVPRWDNSRTVSLALAPTVGRGTVRLVFDVGGARYVVARELRRAASGSVSVRSARLERLRDPSGLGGVEEETEPLADGAGPTTTAVETLLGLPFGDFCTCVVLPQGDFAEFLHAEPRKRQEKLVRILGLGVYDVIAREANSEAAAARQRADVLTEQLGAYADATAEAEQAATARVAELEELVERVGAAVPELAARAGELQAAQATVERLRGERELLAALRAPEGLAELDARHRGAAEELAQAGEQASAAEEADTAARELLAAAPPRGPLEQVRRERAELAVCEAELPGARDRRDKARAAFETAASDAADASAAVEESRAARDAAAAAWTAARDTVAELVAERDGLRGLHVPAGLEAVDVRRSGAARALERADAALAGAEIADTNAREALAAAPARGPLEEARRDRRELAAAEEQHRVAVERAGAAQKAADGATAEVMAARHRLDHARERSTASARAAVAASLRPALEVGHACPVCEQTVQVLPAAAPDPDLDEAESAVRDAEAAHEEARRRESAAAAEHAQAAAEVARLASTIAGLRAALTGVLPGQEPGAVATLTELETALAALDRLTQQLEETDTAVRKARRGREDAAREAEAVRAEVAAATAGLRAARDPLVPFGAPAVEDDDVLAGWDALVRWAHAEAEVREAALPQAGSAVTAAERAHADAERALLAAQRRAQERREEETAAARTEQEARGVAEQLERRSAELRTALEGAVTAEAAAAELARLADLESAARKADAALRAARTSVRTAQQAAADVGQQVAAAWQALRRARDPLVALDAPTLDAGGPLLPAWETLTAWAAGAARVRAEQLTAAEQDAATAREALAGAERGLADDLSAHSVAAASPLGRTALPAAVGMLERARAAHDRIVERRAAAATIAADRDEAASAQQVAKMLGSLLRSDGFPRWLVASALDALVADASASLTELSGGQFELTHSGGEFLVIDHADADARRPVKTLSGGETFQASLALALALSAQMSGLAAHGAARLESIFLDEGFGTLDEANLEVVAGTLESLAARGDRMVGVITHVPALAERVPVRFTVTRDQRTSSVERENL